MKTQSMRLNSDNVSLEKLPSWIMVPTMKVSGSLEASPDKVEALKFGLMALCMRVIGSMVKLQARAG